MGDLDFDRDELMKQGRGNQTAIWHTAVRFAKERDGSVDAWASFVGAQFAPSWDPMGDRPSARRVALQSALNMATTADMRPVDITGDDDRAELLLDGPEQAWLDDAGTTCEDIDRTNELVFRAIAEGRGLTLDVRRDQAGFHLVFAR
ncbi:MAG: hypothetical protein ABI553_00165 [Chloroflexota bacterium]